MADPPLWAWGPLSWPLSGGLKDRHFPLAQLVCHALLPAIYPFPSVDGRPDFRWLPRVANRRQLSPTNSSSAWIFSASGGDVHWFCDAACHLWRWGLSDREAFPRSPPCMVPPWRFASSLLLLLHPLVQWTKACSLIMALPQSHLCTWDRTVLLDEIELLEQALLVLADSGRAR